MNKCPHCDQSISYISISVTLIGIRSSQLCPECNQELAPPDFSKIAVMLVAILAFAFSVAFSVQYRAFYPYLLVPLALGASSALFSRATLVKARQPSIVESVSYTDLRAHEMDSYLVSLRRQRQMCIRDS